MFLKSLPPKNPTPTWTYTRFGVVIPKKEIKLENLKDFFKDSPLSEEKLLQAMRDDNRINIELEADREQRLKVEEMKKKESIEFKLEEKTKEINKKAKLDKEIEEFNEEKEKAMATETKEDDKIVEKKEKELVKKIKEVENESKSK